MPNLIARILLPVDFSLGTSNAKDYACMLAGLLDCDLHLLHVLPDYLPEPAATETWLAPTERPPLKIIQDAKAQLGLCAVNSRINERRIHRDVRFGNAAEQIVKYADDHAIDLIVLATHGRTGLSHAIIGSVAEKVVRLAHCPVLTVHPDTAG